MRDTLSYCSCKSGARVVGGCTHAVSVLYYLCQKFEVSPPETSPEASPEASTDVSPVRSLRSRRRNRSSSSNSEFVRSARKRQRDPVPNIKLSRTPVYEIDCIIQEEEGDDISIRIKRGRFEYSVVSAVKKKKKLILMLNEIFHYFCLTFRSPPQNGSLKRVFLEQNGVYSVRAGYLNLFN